MRYCDNVPSSRYLGADNGILILGRLVGDPNPKPLNLMLTAQAVKHFPDGPWNYIGKDDDDNGE